MLFAVREPTDAGVLEGLPELVVEGITNGDARLLLAAGMPGPLDERVRDRILAETRGNPLALLELPRGLTPAELAGGFGLPKTGTLGDHIEQSFLRRFEALPSDSQRLLLIAAAEPVGDVTLLWRAAERLGIPSDAITPAESAGLIELGSRVRFRHPLVRSAVYRAARVPDRQEVHRALAEATDSEADPDRRAWHRAHAAVGLDEEVAAELERSAGRAQARGGVAAAAAFLERAAELTPDPAQRGTPRPRRCRGEIGGGRGGHGARAPGDCRARTPRRARARAAAEVACANCVRAAAGQRRTATAARGCRNAWLRSTPGLARETCLEGRGCDLHPPPGRCRQRTGGSPCHTTAAASASCDRFATGRAGCLEHRRLRRERAPVAGSFGRLPPRRGERGCKPVALAGVSHRGGSLGRRGMATSWPPAESGRRVRPARSVSFRLRPPSAPGSTCTPGSSPLPRC